VENISFREILFLLKMSRHLHLLFATITHAVEGLNLETFFTLKVEKSLIFFAGICKPTVSIIEQELILFLKTLTRNKASRCCRLEQSVLNVNNSTSIHNYENSWTV
jgi:hypothetical protein